LLIVVVLMLIGGITQVVLQMMEDTYLFREYTLRTVQQEQILHLTTGIDALMEEVFKQDDPDVDYLGEVWSKPYTFSLQKGDIYITIVDQERFLNPNFLVNDKGINKRYLTVFQRLFRLLNIGEYPLYNIIDWIDKDRISSGGREIYDNGLLAKNDKLTTLEELKLIEGITPEIFNGEREDTVYQYGLKDLLSPYSNGRVNINTAPKVVLMALDKDIDESLAEGIIAYRKNKPFKTVNDLMQISGMDSDIIYRISPLIDVKSENFMVYLTVKVGEREYRLQFLYRRVGKQVRKRWQRVM